MRTGGKPHQCSVCQKSFGHLSILNQHMTVHTREKPYQCSVCQKSFGQTSNLNKHMKLHTGEKPYQCSVCHKSFVQKSHKKSHMIVHTGEKPHPCSVCQKSFGQKSNLKQHMKLHTGEKSYQCAVCQKSFGWMSHLNQHMKLHTGEKPYQCSVCHKSFARKHSLKKHMKLYTAGKPHQLFAEKYRPDSHASLHAKQIVIKLDPETGFWQKFERDVLTDGENMSHVNILSSSELELECEEELSGKLNKHTRVHTGEKTQQCSVREKLLTEQHRTDSHASLHAKQSVIKLEPETGFCQKFEGGDLTDGENVSHINMFSPSELKLECEEEPVVNVKCEEEPVVNVKCEEGI